MKPFTTFSGLVAPLPLDHVDTDQIIPASFLKGVDREGLAEGLFHGWRFLDGGAPDPGFVLHKPEYAAATILMVGENFGCGSSREHAPWALQAWGFRTLIGRSFADIFRNNAHRNGLLTVTLNHDRFQTLLSLLHSDPSVFVTVNLEGMELVFPDGSTEGFHVDPFARHCMLNGRDHMDHLLNHLSEIERYETRVPARVQVASPDTGPDPS